MANSTTFKKGNPGKPKGTPNKVTVVTQQALAEALAGSTDKIKEALAKLEHDPYQYINAVTKLLPFIVPKKTDITTDGEKVNIPDLSKLSFSELFELKYGRKPD